MPAFHVFQTSVTNEVAPKPGTTTQKPRQATKRRRRRKIRTPEHVRADMSLHHVAFQIVRCGFSVEFSRTDYGYDAYVAFYDPVGQVETGYVFAQLKATDDVSRFRTLSGISYSIDMRDFDLWADNPYPVYFVLFDAGTETAYWLYFQKYVQERGLTSANVLTETLTVHLDPASRFDATTAFSWQMDKNNALAQIPRISHV
jgi:hypothetical protein